MSDRKGGIRVLALYDLERAERTLHVIKRFENAVVQEGRPEFAAFTVPELTRIDDVVDELYLQTEPGRCPPNIR